MICFSISFVFRALLGFVLICGTPFIEAQKGIRRLEQGPAVSLSQILCRPTDCSATLSVLSAVSGDAHVEWGAHSGEFSSNSNYLSLQAGVPMGIEIKGLL